MPETRPEDPKPEPGPKYVVPLLLLLILAGIATPFLVTMNKKRLLRENQNAVLTLLREFSAAQERHFAREKAYAQTFAELGGKFASLPDAASSSDLHGYRFRILTAQNDSAPGGAMMYVEDSGKMTRNFALLAVPAKYGYTGNDTIQLRGKEVYIVDLGTQTDFETYYMKSFRLLFGAPGGGQVQAVRLE
ncbi:MAG: DUF2950 family protein [Acidobacteriota bacterium]